jgi:hypothetical protein
VGDADLTVMLGRLSSSCHDAAASAGDLAERYTALRAQAMRLNDRHGWATADQFDAQFPSVGALLEIQSLDRALGAASSPVERGAAALITEALLHLASWATGARLAYETLREMDSR